MSLTTPKIIPSSNDKKNLTNSNPVTATTNNNNNTLPQAKINGTVGVQQQQQNLTTTILVNLPPPWMSNKMVLFGQHNLHSSDMSSEEKSYVENFIRTKWKDVFEKKILPGIHFSMYEQRPLGVLYVLSGMRPAGDLLYDKKNLCAGISVYDINVPIDARSGSVSTDFLESANSIFSHMSVCFSDMSLFESTKKMSRWFQLDPEIIIQEKWAGVTHPEPFMLGEDNCSISLCKSVDVETARIQWHLVVRNYDPVMSHLLSNFIKSKPEMTVSQVFQHPLYKQTIRYSSTLRNALAAQIVKMLNCNFSSSPHISVKDTEAGYVTQINNSEDLTQEYFGSKLVGLPNPTYEQMFNILAQVNYTNNNNQKDVKYGFFDGCCNIGDHQTKGVVYGLGRDAGYQLFSINNPKRFRFGFDEYLGSFPLGVPRKEVIISTTSSLNELSPEKTSQSSIVHWGGNFGENIKGSRTVRLYDGGFYQQKKPLIFDMLIGNNISKSNEIILSQIITDRKLVAVECYINSPNEARMNIHTLFKFRSKKDNFVRIPRANVFLVNDFMRLYLIHSANKKFTNTSQETNTTTTDSNWSITKVIVKEDEDFIYLNTNALSEMLDLQSKMIQPDLS